MILCECREASSDDDEKKESELNPRVVVRVSSSTCGVLLCNNKSLSMSCVNESLV